MMPVPPTVNTVNIPLAREEALVLVDWLSSFAQRQSLPVHDDAELIVLWRIQAYLEHTLSELNDPAYDEIVARARHVAAGQTT